jgi:hypothetical protein
MATLVDLYRNRCTPVDGKLKPNFWLPKDINYTPPCIYVDTDKPVEKDWGVEQVLSRSFAVNKYLEDDGAGYFVGQALNNKEELPDHPIIKPLLQSNIKDEKFHQRGVDALCDIYSTPEDLAAAQELGELWKENSEKHHPLFPVAVLETGVFMLSLGFWRVFGGETIADAASSIAFDEMRHVKTNRSVLKALGYNPSSTPEDLLKLTLDTLDWVFEGVNVPENLTPGYDWKMSSLWDSCFELLETGNAESLNDVAFFGEYFAHFETNASYSRAVM